MSTSYPDPRDIQRRADELMERTRAAAAEVAAQSERRRAASAGREERIAQARRDGEHGPDWQVLQQRIDMRRTTVSDVLNGLDHSEEARAVRRTLGVNLARAREVLREATADPEGPVARQLVAGIEAAQAENS